MSMQQLRERKQEISRMANKLIADKGDIKWTKEDQAVFDSHVDDMEQIDRQITSMQRMLDITAEKAFGDAKPVDKTVPLENRQQGLDLFLRKSFRDMTPDEVGVFRNTMSTTTGGQGGYTVQTEIASQFVDFLKDYGGVRRVADRIVTSMGNNLSFPTTDGTAEVGEIVSQNATASSADVSFGTVPVNTFKFGSKTITVPIELLQDTNIDIVGLIQKRMRDRIGRFQNQQFSTGDGTTGPFGLTTAAGIGKTAATGNTTTITYVDLVDTIDSVDYAYQQLGGLQWMFGQSLRKVLRKIVDTAGRPIWLPGYGSLNQPEPDTLLGYEVNINNDMPAPGANNLSLSFGQHQKFLIRDSMEITMFRFEDSPFVRNGQVGFLAWARAGSNLLDTSAVKTFKHSAT